MGCKGLSLPNAAIHYTSPYKLFEMEDGQLYPTGATASIKCHDGYILAGPKIQKCINFDVWKDKEGSPKSSTMETSSCNLSTKTHS